jgi:thymidylate synthase
MKMNNLDIQYQTLLQKILDDGVVKKDRTGTGTKSIFGYKITHNMSEGFPLLTTKKLYTKGVVAEMLWFLRGQTNIKELIEMNTNIWNGDAYKKFVNIIEKERTEDYTRPTLTQEEFVDEIKFNNDFANKWGDLGPIYGKQWRNWEGKVHGLGYGSFIEIFDQVGTLINDLKNNPDSRRLIVNAWNVAEIPEMTLPPCHVMLQCYTRELSISERESHWRNNMGMKNIQYMVYSYDGEEGLHKEYDKQNVPRRAISLQWYQRSVDTFLGLPFNIASYGLLLCILGEIVNMVPETLTGMLGDTHLYLNHLEQAKEQIGRELDIEERWNLRYDYFPKDKQFPWDRMNLPPHEFLDQFNIPKRTREPFELPKLNINGEFWVPGTTDGCGMGAGTYSDNLDTLFQCMEVGDFTFENYKSHPAIKAPLSN